jgi:hypothetical protein
MVRTSFEKFAESIGFEIGSSDDCTQAELLNAFCKGLNNSIPDNHNLDMQLCYIADKLNSKTEKILIRLIEFIKTKND